MNIIFAILLIFDFKKSVEHWVCQDAWLFLVVTLFVLDLVLTYFSALDSE